MFTRLTNTGTGKTSTARKMGKVFYDMGFLAKAEVVERSATELVGTYVGHTGPKVQKVLENALGRVLFIDEAYRLAGEGFAKEAMDEIVDCLTKPKYAQKLIVILAGYDDDINRLMAQNPGLTSRFPEAIIFRGLKPTDCLDLLIQLLRGRQRDMRKKKKDLDLSALESPAPHFKQETLDQFDTLGRIANWANARDVQTIAKSIFNLLLKVGAMKQPIAVVTEDHVRSVLDSMISERSRRQEAAKIRPSFLHSDMMARMHNIQAPPPPQIAATSSSAMSTSEAEPPQQLAKDVLPADTASEIKRDSGVSDAVWEKLQRDKQAAKEKEERCQKLLKASADAANNIKLLQQKEQASEQAFQATIKQNEDQVALQEAKRLHEEARLQHEMERRAQEDFLADLERQRKAGEEERRKEAKAQQKLRTLGICPMGFRWIKQNGGYRCSAGGHFVTDSELGL
jgi:ATPase family associated with various cellular activities (AAA)